VLVNEDAADRGEQAMTMIEQSVLRALEPVTFDLYRDIHKGIRAELFAVTGAAGNLDPDDREGRADLACHIQTVATMLVAHAEHEDAVIQPALETHLPALAETVAIDHPVLEARIQAIRDLAAGAVDAPSFASRNDVHRVYMELASFTSAYLAHQDLEERDIMPALARSVGYDEILAIHRAIVGSIPPEEMAKTLAVMLPAMNVDDRTELLGGMQQGAPAAVFEQVWGSARSVLTTADGNAVARRLGIA
jgi:hypothetical protein